jgi:hypothetical protein
VCIPDFKLLVALSVLRSGFLADFQPPGASNSPPGLKKQKKLHETASTKTPIYIYISLYIQGHGDVDCKVPTMDLLMFIKTTPFP